jgi:hypothetical protein
LLAKDVVGVGAQQSADCLLVVTGHVVLALGGPGPLLAVLLEMPDLKSLDESSYAAASALVEYLLTRGDESTGTGSGSAES